MPLGVVEWNSEYRVTRFSRRAEEILGWAAADVLGRRLDEIPWVPEEDWPSVRAVMRDMSSGARPVNVNANRNLRKDGSVVHCEWYNSTIHDSAGRLVSALSLVLDVTGRTIAEQATRESRAKLDSALASMTDAVFISDAEGRFVEFNDAFATFHRFASRDECARTFGEYPDLLEVFTADGARAPVERWAVPRALRGETVTNAEYVLRRKDTGETWVGSYSFGPLRRDGEIVGSVVVARDVTERKRAEEELKIVTRLYAVLSRVNEAIVRIRDEQALYEEVCRIVADEGGFPLVWVGLVRDRRIVPAASWGRAAGYLGEIEVEVDGPLGQGPTGVCVRERRPVINDDFGVNPSTWPWRQPTLRYGLRASAAFPLARGDQVIGALTFYAAEPGAFTPKQVNLLEALCADLSYALDAMRQERLRSDAERALRQSEQSLREADRRKDDFLGMLSHELRNPLAPIRNSVYILNHADPAGEPARRARAVIQRQTEHLTRLVDDLLDVTRIARGKIELRRERIDVADVVRRTAEDLRAVLSSRDLELVVEVPPARLWVHADETRLAQVVGNLLHNAGKFTPPGGRVEVSVRAGDGIAELRVRDTGVGIEPELLERVFEPFVQSERSLARTQGGLGLGLALVKGIVELHGGSVRAESAGPGRGAELVVILPLASTPEARSAPAGETTPGAGRRVLVVDDNRDAAESLAQLLEVRGHTADVAFDGPTAIRMAGATRYDVILCDIGLPGMSGYEVATALRNGAGNGAQLIAVSGYAQPEDLARAADAGFDGHVAKPADPERILQLLA
ncbi:hypothetical protein AMOR_09810 [Anaeromyxobacter oryzae]|uniref:histidine kinase n=2 Tax=Anaeromyxobacter oryzae TaxID=2918170 RepID=A0ABN6MM12_9BACT|nr:hypothetical protein AMOR_09810 [Anaeromyxobacter oryzae]